FGEEMREPSRLIAKAILTSLVLTLVFEIAPTIALLMGTPDLHATLTAGDPFGLLARMRAGGWMADAIAVSVVIAIVNAIIACILACARFFYGTA
ncbi:amino acid permease, partial [Clostridium perfringens]